MKKAALILASALVLAGTATAGIGYDEEGIVYNYLTAEWIRLDEDGYDHGNGGGLTVSWSPCQHWYVTGSGSFAEVGNVDVNNFSAGLGYYHPFCPKLHAAVDAGFAWMDIDYPGWGTESGFYINPHLRWKPCPMTEVHAGAIYHDFDNNDSDWTGYARLFVEIFPAVDLTASYQANSDWNIISGGVRLRF